MTIYLHGLHDLGGENLMQDAPGWIVDAISLQESRAYDYRHISSRGIQVLCRLNWGWSPQGSIPESSQYSEMASRCAKFVADSPGCTRWIIGNEFNHEMERPNGKTISAEDAAICHRLCYDAIKQVNPNHAVIVAAVAPWNLQSGDWLEYYRRLVFNIGSRADGYAIHSPTHGSNPDLVFNDQMVNGWYWHFRTYKDQLRVLLLHDSITRGKPIYITESNQGDEAWKDERSKWIENTLREIEYHNKVSSQKIYCVAYYRWKNYSHDRWGMEHKSNVVDNFKQAVSLKILSPHGLTAPDVSSGDGGGNSGSPSPNPTRDWDPRLTERGVVITTPNIANGEKYWKVTRGRWLPENEAGGKHHILVNTKSEDGSRLNGIPFRVIWPSGFTNFTANKNPNEPYSGDFGMSPSLKEFTIFVSDGRKSEVVSGIGMGANGNPGIHTSTELDWTLTTYRDESIPTVPQLPAPIEPEKEVIRLPLVLSNEERWTRSRAFVRRWEGGYQNISNDRGNWTGCAVNVGELKGTKYGISACSYPALDIKNLTMEQADQIYFRDYWVASGADRLPWPECLIVFDTAVLHGVGAARRWMADVGANGYYFVAKRLESYLAADNWEFWDEAWIRRVIALLKEIGAAK